MGIAYLDVNGAVPRPFDWISVSCPLMVGAAPVGPAVAHPAGSHPGRAAARVVFPPTWASKFPRTSSSVAPGRRPGSASGARSQIRATTSRCRTPSLRIAEQPPAAVGPCAMNERVPVSSGLSPILAADRSLWHTAWSRHPESGVPDTRVPAGGRLRTRDYAQTELGLQWISTTSGGRRPLPPGGRTRRHRRAPTASSRPDRGVRRRHRVHGCLLPAHFNRVKSTAVARRGSL